MTNNKHLGIVFPEFERKLTETMDKHRAAGKKIAVTLARKNLPTRDADTHQPLLTIMTEAYNQTHAEHEGIIKIEVHRATHDRLAADVRKRSEEIDTEIEKLEQENLIERRALDGTVCPPLKRRNILAMVLVGVLSLGEVFWISTALQALGDIMPLTAMGISLALAGVQSLIAVAISKQMHKLEQTGQRMDMRTALLIAALAGMVISLTVMRGYAINAMESSMPSWLYLFIHIALIVGTVLSARAAFPSPEEKDGVRQLRERFQKIEEREKQCDTLLAEKKALEKTVLESEEHLSLVESQAHHLRNLVRTHFRESVAQCKTENLITRTDMTTPVSFHAPAPLLEFEQSA